MSIPLLALLRLTATTFAARNLPFTIVNNVTIMALPFLAFSLWDFRRPERVFFGGETRDPLNLRRAIVASAGAVGE